MKESGLLPRSRCSEIFDRVTSAARSAGVSQVELILSAEAFALTRFANNAIHQNVAERGRHLSVRVITGGRTARASTNRCDDDAVRNVVTGAIALARSRESDPDLLPLPEPAPITPVDRHSEATAACTPAARARAVAQAVEVAKAASQTAAGICSTEESVHALLNSRGVFACHAETMARFSITAMAAGSAGWAKAGAVDLTGIDPVALARAASRKADLSRSPRPLDPGSYTVILEPAAVLDLLGQMFPDFSATALADHRSFLTGRLGSKLFGDNITIHDDVYHPFQTGSPFDGEGVPRRRLALVENGTPRDLARSRLSAARDRLEPTGHGLPLPNQYGELPLNIVIAGGASSLEQMIASTPRGILVTRLWYIREVDPYEKIMTGMTRDGTFLVEDGRPVCGIRNFRFNQSLIEMLRNVAELSPAVRASGEEAIDMVVPAMKVNGFQFTDVTRF